MNTRHRSRVRGGGSKRPARMKIATSSVGPGASPEPGPQLAPRKNPASLFGDVLHRSARELEHVARLLLARPVPSADAKHDERAARSDADDRRRGRANPVAGVTDR